MVSTVLSLKSFKPIGFGVETRKNSAHSQPLTDGNEFQPNQKLQVSVLFYTTNPDFVRDPYSMQILLCKLFIIVRVFSQTDFTARCRILVKILKKIHVNYWLRGPGQVALERKMCRNQFYLNATYLSTLALPILTNSVPRVQVKASF